MTTRPYPPSEATLYAHYPTKGTNGTAIKHDAAKPRYSLLPQHALDQIIAVLEYGAGKYGTRNWMGGMAWSRCFDAAMRHLWAWFRGQDVDDESGLPHLSHAAVNLLFLLEYKHIGVGEDDRKG